MKESTLMPHQERVVIERAELDENITKLSAFLNDEVRTAIPMDEEVRLRNQLYIMMVYSSILDERIASF